MTASQSRYDSLLQRAADVDLSLGSNKIGLKTGWTDEIFESLTQDCRLNYEEDATKAKAMIFAWLDKFYSSSQGKFNSVNYLLGAIQLSPLLKSDNPSSHKQTEVEFLTEITSRLAKLITHENQVEDQTDNSELPFHEMDDDEQRQLAASSSGLIKEVQIRTQSVAKGSDEVMKLLEEYDKNETALRCIVSFQALICCRMVVKNPETVANYFLSTFNDTLRSIHAGVPFDSIVGAPSQEFLRKIRMDIGSTQNEAKTLIKRILRKYYDIVKINKDETKSSSHNRTLEALLYAGCLLHWRGNGMGALGLTITMQELKRKSLTDILDACAVQEMIDSLDMITTYCTSYLKTIDKITSTTKVKSITWWWARLIDPEYFSDASVPNNLIYCFVMAYWLQDVQPNILEKTGLKDLDEQSKITWEAYAKLAAPKWLKTGATHAFGKVSAAVLEELNSRSSETEIKDKESWMMLQQLRK